MTCRAGEADVGRLALLKITLLCALFVMLTACSGELGIQPICDDSYSSVGWNNVQKCTAKLQSQKLSTYDRAMTLNIRGNNYDGLKRYDLAIADYTKVISLMPDFDYAYANRGMEKCREGHCKEALADYDKALSLNPGNDWARYGRGVARLRSGDPSGAKADFAAVNSHGLDTAAVYRQIGMTPFGVETIIPTPNIILYWVPVVLLSALAGAVLTVLGISFLVLRNRRRRSKALKQAQARAQEKIPDPFIEFDHVLLPWALSHGLQVQTDDRGYVVRSTWPPRMRNPEPVGQKPQLWLGWPEKDGGLVEVNVAVGRWKHTATATQQTLAGVLSQQLDFLESRSLSVN